MKILIDIGHPAHVHYFKHFIWEMEKRGHTFLITARNKEITFDLLEKYGISYINRGKGGSSLLGKLLYILKADRFLLKQARKFKPDIFLSFASTYAAHAAWLSRRPHIALDDTEHAKLELLLYPPFTKAILTPSCFKKNLGKKQIRFHSFIELASLHPNYFSPDPSILQVMGVEPGEPYAILRFISWSASHDIGQTGIDLDSKKKLVDTISQKMKVFISSEGDLPEDLKPYQIRIAPHQMHDALAFAALYIGEGGTTATECAVLGVPNILINPLAKTVGAHHLLQDHFNIQYFFDDLNSAEQAINTIIDDPQTAKEKWTINREKLLNETIDITALLVWFVGHYPKSRKRLQADPSFQQQFK